MNWEKLQNLLQKATKRNDIVLAAFLMVIISIMILPMPTVIVDMLVAINMTLAILMLMTSVYVTTPLAFSAFPAILLISTLFRLALSITTTRLILLQADAGDIITTFGEFVVGGNIVVGLVVFTIITLVQFIVITKGSERVAEVSARFSLDAMPGKQMSIDGDMRAGVIDAEQAKLRRERLTRESQLFGSMDGAMKFVKGDAIAGIFIILINIIGGISIGAMQRGMEVGEAAQIYTILTVGDGLIAQIPALFISIAAGIIVTRVGAKDARNLGQEIGGQLLAQPKALMIASSVLFGFALIPGFPSSIFIFLAILLGGIGFTIKTAKDSDGGEETAFIEALKKARNLTGTEQHDELEGSHFGSNEPISIDLCASLSPCIDHERLNLEFSLVRQAMYKEFGVKCPGVQLNYRPEISDQRYVMSISDVPCKVGLLEADHVIANNVDKKLEQSGLSFETRVDPSSQAESFWVHQKHIGKLKELGIDYLDIHQVLSRRLAAVLRANVSEFVGVQETSLLVSQLKVSCADLVKEVQGALTLPLISDVLKILLEEGISIKNLKAILEGALKKSKQDKDPHELAEAARIELRRQIIFNCCPNNEVIGAVMLEGTVEETIRKSIKAGADGTKEVLLSRDTGYKFIEKLKDVVKKAESDDSKTMLVTSKDIRRFVRSLTKLPLATLPVLSYQELPAEAKIRPVGRVSIE